MGCGASSLSEYEIGTILQIKQTDLIGKVESLVGKNLYKIKGAYTNNVAWTRTCRHRMVVKVGEETRTDDPEAPTVTTTKGPAMVLEGQGMISNQSIEELPVPGEENDIKQDESVELSATVCMDAEVVTFVNPEISLPDEPKGMQEELSLNNDESSRSSIAELATSLSSRPKPKLANIVSFNSMDEPLEMESDDFSDSEKQGQAQKAENDRIQKLRETHREHRRVGLPMKDAWDIDLPEESNETTGTGLRRRLANDCTSGGVSAIVLIGAVFGYFIFRRFFAKRPRKEEAELDLEAGC